VKHMRHFGRATPAREALQIRALIADINRVVQILNGDIAAEEEQTQIFDRSQAEYPMLAGTLAARRDNLIGTITLLEERLSSLQAFASGATPSVVYSEASGSENGNVVRSATKSVSSRINPQVGHQA
jgi:hypothetical protein